MRSKSTAVWMVAAALALAAACVETRSDDEPAAAAAVATSPLGFDDDCPDLCDSVCWGDDTCGKSCNYWDEHPGSGSGSGSEPPYRHCRQTTCEAQVPIPCDEPPPEPCPDSELICEGNQYVWIHYVRDGRQCIPQRQETNDPCEQ